MATVHSSDFVVKNMTAFMELENSHMYKEEGWYVGMYIQVFVEVHKFIQMLTFAFTNIWILELVHFNIINLHKI